MDWSLFNPLIVFSTFLFVKAKIIDTRIIGMDRKKEIFFINTFIFAIILELKINKLLSVTIIKENGNQKQII